jgi:hypothetical protein
MNLDADDKVPQFEVVGLHHNTKGCRCCIHSHCGKHLRPNDILCLVYFVAQIRNDAEPEDAIKLVKIVDGTEACTVGFIPRSFAKMQQIRSRIGECCIVVELYDESTNAYERRLSEKNYGMASCMFVNDVPRQE